MSSSDGIERKPVTKEALEKASGMDMGANGKPSHLQGVVSPGLQTGPVDKKKERLAKMASGASPNLRQAGMMLDYAGPQGTWGSSSTDAFNTSYATGNIMYGQRDIPTYFVMMNQQNGGVLYWPASLREKYEWYRYFARTDAFVGRALELLSDLPMSKITLNMPKMKNSDLQDKILLFYKDMCNRMNLFQRLQEILWEWNMIGNCFDANHRVHTPEGMLSIAEIREGDLVLTHNGHYKQVNATTRRKISEYVVDIGLSRAKAIRLQPTDEHPILVLRNDIEDFIEAKNLRVGDYVSMVWRNSETDIDNINIIKNISSILSYKYDYVKIEGKQIEVSYSKPTGIGETATHIKDSLLNWLSNLKEPIVYTCEELAFELGIDNYSKLRTAAYSLKRKKIIHTERTSKGRIGGSAIKWFPVEEKYKNGVPTDVFSRKWTKQYDIVKSVINIDEDFMYLLGYWFGDGWLWKYDHQQSKSYVAFDIVVDKESPCIEILREKFEVIFGDNFEELTGGICNDDMLHFVVKDFAFCEWWGNEFGNSSENKKIPNWIERLPKEKLIWLLRGLIDSDGSVNENSGVSITTITEQLMQSVFRIGLYCGVPFSFYKQEARISKLPNDKTVCGKESYRLQISDCEKVNYLIKGCVKEIDVELGNKTPNSGYIEKDGRFYYRINELSLKHFEGYVYNLEVDDDHTYCVENVCTHNCFVFHEWDEERKAWSKAVILPPEEVSCFTYPFSDNARIEYKPQKLIDIIQSAVSSGNTQIDPKEKEIVEHIPEDVIDMIIKENCIVMDSDPLAGGSVGSFTYHFARRRSPYLDLGASVLERVLVPMLMKENYRYTQLALATRNMTPKNKISAPGLTQPELDGLREQLDLSYMDPDYTIVTNYEWEWEQIGADGRILDLQGEYESIENQVFAGLGVTRELLTGEGTYSGNRITIEILNTIFLLTREMLKSYVEDSLFRPVAEAHGWYSENEMGIREYWHPKLTFNRLSIRDNQEVFENLFQLYQKGSLPIDIIFELLNLDSDNIAEQVKNDLFTVKDPTFNRTVENLNDETGRNLAEQSNIVEKIAEYLGLELKPGGEEDDMGFGDDFGGGGFGEEPSFDEEPSFGEEPSNEEDADSEEETSPDTEQDADSEETSENDETKSSEKAALNQIADEITEHIPTNADREDVEKIVRKLDESDEKEESNEEEK